MESQMNLRDYLDTIKNFNDRDRVSDKDVLSLKQKLVDIFNTKNWVIPPVNELFLANSFSTHTNPDTQTNLMLHIVRPFETLYMMEIESVNGQILYVAKADEREPCNTNQLCDLQSSPSCAHYKGFTFENRAGKLFVNDKYINVIYHEGSDMIDGELADGSHTPFSQSGDPYDEQILFIGLTQEDFNLSEYLIPAGSIEVVLCRLAWGYNLALAYFDFNQGIMVCGKPRNYDYPEPTGLEYIPDLDDVIIHLEFDEPKLTQIYVTDQKFTPNLNLMNVYGYMSNTTKFELKNERLQIKQLYSKCRL
jgi:hypothetical protein